jgi:2-oxoglutarate dehydrogenase E2 component (dihydrolipoamide succinyltransferase)
MPAEVQIPQLGESVSEGVIARWLRQDGDTVKADEPILELETDKATMELAATASGQLQIVEREGTTVRVGTVVARIAEGAVTAAPKPAGAPARGPEAKAPEAKAAAGKSDAVKAPVTSAPAAKAPAGKADDLSPAVRKLVTEHRVDTAAVSGTGRGGRLTKGDVLDHIERRGAGGREPPGAALEEPSAEGPIAEESGAEAAGATADRPAAATAERPAAATAGPPPAGPAVPVTAEPLTAGAAVPTTAERPGTPALAQRVRMTQLRRRIAERLVEAQRTAAILTTFNEIDVSALLAVRKRYRERFRQTHEVDLGLMSLFGRATILALRDVPIVNAEIDGSDIVYHREVHLGIAVSTPRGLVVPVVRSADSMSLAELERAIAETARLGREGKLTPDHLAGGTFTITNGGVFGSLLSTPILNPPQSGILGMHKIEDRPVAVDGQVVIRPMMYVALSYDHRLVDGQQAVTFLVRVKERLEDPVRMLLEV